MVVASVKYNYSDKIFVSKRGFSFLITEKEKIILGQIIKIRVNRNMPEQFYYEDYQNY
ncbi:hypothetical protein H650_00880 [Enterobacter sp. R4-368]|nr:hypothetical protein H650_00880 [Enterobacter sp. R4-368]